MNNLVRYCTVYSEYHNDGGRYHKIAIGGVGVDTLASALSEGGLGGLSAELGVSEEVVVRSERGQRCSFGI